MTEQFKRNGASRNEKPRHTPMTDVDGRMVPRDTDLEQTVLGAIMLERDAYTSVCDIIKPESFYDPAHQKIYSAVQQLGMRQQPIDMLTVTEQLRLDEAPCI